MIMYTMKKKVVPRQASEFDIGNGWGRLYGSENVPPERKYET